MQPIPLLARPRAAVLLLPALLIGAVTTAQDRLPKEDVIDVPAIGDGLCVHNLFQSNMVLQRDKPIRVWGWAAPGEQVTVTFRGEAARSTAAGDRSWQVTLPAQPARSTPAAMTIAGQQRTLTLDNVLIGDVWLLGGQSNMEFPLERVDNGWLEIVSARFEGMRILTVPAQNGPDAKRSFPRLHEWSGWFNQHFRKGDWDVCRPEIARELSAIGYVFARRIHMATSATPSCRSASSRCAPTVRRRRVTTTSSACSTTACTSARRSTARSSTCARRGTRTSASPAASTSAARGTTRS